MLKITEAPTTVRRRFLYLGFMCNNHFTLEEQGAAVRLVPGRERPLDSFSYYWWE